MALTCKVVDLGTRSTLFAPRWTGCATARMWKSATVATLLSRVVVGVVDTALSLFDVIAFVNGSDCRMARFTRSYLMFEMRY